MLLGRPTRIASGPKRLLLIALGVPLVTMIPALAWAWGKPIFGIGNMALYHGLVDAIGHVGLAMFAFTWARPAAQSGYKPVDESNENL